MNPPQSKKAVYALFCFVSFASGRSVPLFLLEKNFSFRKTQVSFFLDLNSYGQNKTNSKKKHRRKGSKKTSGGSIRTTTTPTTTTLCHPFCSSSRLGFSFLLSSPSPSLSLFINLPQLPFHSKEELNLITKKSKMCVIELPTTLRMAKSNLE